MKPNRLTIALAALTAASLAAAPLDTRADDTVLAPQEVPAKSLPVPTDVSPGMQKFIAAPLNPTWHDLWKTGDEWPKAADKKRCRARSVDEQSRSPRRGCGSPSFRPSGSTPRSHRTGG